MRCLSKNEHGKVLNLIEKVDENSVLDILKKKNTNLEMLTLTATPDYTTLPYHPASFDSLNTSRITSAALKYKGCRSDFNEWRRILTSFDRQSSDTCKTIGKMAVRIFTENLDFLDAYSACRLIALDKNPGVRPIGIGEVLRRIFVRNITNCLQ